MSRRVLTRTFPDPPNDWPASSREVWYRLVQILEASELFDKARRTRPQILVKGTVSAPTTLDVNNPEVTALTHVFAKLLVALEGSNFIDIRKDV